MRSVLQFVSARKWRLGMALRSPLRRRSPRGVPSAREDADPPLGGFPADEAGEPPQQLLHGTFFVIIESSGAGCQAKSERVADRRWSAGALPWGGGEATAPSAPKRCRACSAARRRIVALT